MATPLERMHDALTLVGIPDRGRVKIVCEITGYSQGMVSKILSGKTEMADKFVKLVCTSLYINTHWVVSGVEPVLTQAILPPGDVAFKEAISILSAMTESERWRAVAVLKAVANK